MASLDFEGVARRDTGGGVAEWRRARVFRVFWVLKFVAAFGMLFCMPEDG